MFDFFSVNPSFIFQFFIRFICLEFKIDFYFNLFEYYSGHFPHSTDHQFKMTNFYFNLYQNMTISINYYSPLIKNYIINYKPLLVH